MTSVLSTYFTFNIRNQPTIGDTKTSITNKDHIGWLRCDGRILNVADFYQLYQVIGNSFSNTSYTAGTQFQLPDARGRVSGFVNNLSNATTHISARALGSNFGEENHTLTIAEMPTHSHPGVGGVDGAGNGITSSNATGITATDSGHTHSYNTTNTTGGLSIGGAPAAGSSGATTGTGNANITITDPTHAHSVYKQGDSNAHNNMQPTIFMGNMFVFCGKATYNAPYAGMGVTTTKSSDGSFTFPYQ